MSLFKKDKYSSLKERPSYMQPTESSAKKTREKIHNPCAPRRLTTRREKAASMVDIKLDSSAAEDSLMPQMPRCELRKQHSASVCLDDVPRYMQPTESSAKKMIGEKYKLRPPRIPQGSLRNNMTTPKAETTRVQMSNVAMDPFVESLRRGSVSDRSHDTLVDQAKELSHRSRRNKSRAEGNSKGVEDGWAKATKEVPRYQQPTVLTSLRAYRRTRS